MWYKLWRTILCLQLASEREKSWPGVPLLSCKWTLHNKKVSKKQKICPITCSHILNMHRKRIRKHWCAYMMTTRNCFKSYFMTIYSIQPLALGNSFTWHNQIQIKYKRVSIHARQHSKYCPSSCTTSPWILFIVCNNK